MAIYDLTQQHLAELPHYAQKAFPYNLSFYNVGDVEDKARKVCSPAKCPNVFNFYCEFYLLIGSWK